MKINKKLIGNLLILLSEQCKPLYHTKLLKLLYLIDQESVKRTGAPITWLSYHVWQFGPVSEDVYFSKTDGLNKFHEFVKFDPVSDNKYIVRPVSSFDDLEFSDRDLQTIKDVLDEYGRFNTKQLVEITHAKDSLWDKAKKTHGIHFSDQNKTSPITLEFSELIRDDDFKKTIYCLALESIEFQYALSGYTV